MRTKENNNYSINLILAICFILTLIIPYFNYYARGLVIPFAIFLLWAIKIIFNKEEFKILLKFLLFRRIEFFLLLCFFCFTTYTYLFITPTTKAFQFTLIPILYSFVLVLDTYYSLLKPFHKKQILLIIILSLGAQAAISIPYILQSSVLVARLFTSGGLEGSRLVEALRNGVGGTALYTTLSGFIFFVVGAIKMYGQYKYIIVLCLISILISILISTFTLPIVLTGVGILFLSLRVGINNIKFRYFILLATILIGIYILFKFVLIESQLIDPVIHKIELINEGKLEKDGRGNLANISLSSFASSPFFGIGVPEWGKYEQIGEHMPWVDFLAHYGLLGFLPYLLFLLVLWLRNVKFYFSFSSEKFNLYNIGCLVGYSIFIIANFVNPLIFEAPMVIMLIFFYTSISNWARIIKN